MRQKENRKNPTKPKKKLDVPPTMQFINQEPFFVTKDHKSQNTKDRPLPYDAVSNNSRCSYLI